MNTSIYQNIATRTAGDIYIGVVGPVRTGKSTFIKRFMETQVIPNIDNVYRKERARDELPQSGSGRTIMTAEPKFVPEEAAQIQLPDGASFSVRLIDCVGYMVKGAIGQMEDDTPRMVTTPWYDHEIPMTEAAEIGTRKVIAEHSTIGIVITTDGTISDIPREDYLEAEERVIRELQELGKPFIVLLNSADPRGDRAQAIAKDISSRYEVNCMAVNCLELDEDAVAAILKAVLYEFPMQELDLFLPPGWMPCRRTILSKRACMTPSVRTPPSSATSGRWRASSPPWGRASTSVRPESQPSTWAPAWPPHGWPCPGSCSTRPCRSSPALRWGMMGI